MANLADIRVILFDAVGTLIYPSPPAVDVYQQVGAQWGANLSRDEVACRFRNAFATIFAKGNSTPTSHAIEHQRWREVVSAVFGDTPAPLNAIFEQLWTHFAKSENWSLFPDVADVWRTLEQRGFELGIASNFDDRLPEVLGGLPPLSTCRHVFWSSRIGYAKPHPRFFQTVADLLQTPPDTLLLVGDDWQNDVLGATAAGWRAVYLDRTSQAPTDRAITTFTDIMNFLD